LFWEPFIYSSFTGVHDSSGCSDLDFWSDVVVASPLPDAHGDITTLADAEGEVASRQAYDPWGTQLSGPALEMGYLGAQQRRSDPSTGLVQMGIRPYSPALGSFMAEDPILGHLGMSVTLNRYAYVGNNPLLYFDLTGRSFVGDIGGAIGTAWDETGGRAWDATAGARTAVGVAGDGNGGALSEVPGFTSDRAQAFWKATGDYILSCSKNGAMGAGVGAVAGLGAFGGGAAAGALVGGSWGCAQGLAQQALDDLGQEELSDALDYGSGVKDAGKLLRDFDDEAPWLKESLKDLLEIF
jgi:RHS repeat-associated protein